AVRVDVSEPLERALVLVRARSELNEERPGFDELRHGGDDEIDSLLIRKARDDTEDRPLQILRQREAGEEVALARSFPVEVVDVVPLGDVRVVAWVPILVVDAVEDADEVAMPCPQQAVHLEAVLGGLDLLRV